MGKRKIKQKNANYLRNLKMNIKSDLKLKLGFLTALMIKMNDVSKKIWRNYEFRGSRRKLGVLVLQRLKKNSEIPGFCV